MGLETANQGDKQGLGLGKRNKRQMEGQQMVVLLAQMAHNVVVWSQRWLADAAPRLRRVWDQAHSAGCVWDQWHSASIGERRCGNGTIEWVAPPGPRGGQRPVRVVASHASNGHDRN